MESLRNMLEQDAFARHLVQEIGVAPVPGGSFYRDKSMGADKVRFCFSKRWETLEEAGQRLARLQPR